MTIFLKRKMTILNKKKEVFNNKDYYQEEEESKLSGLNSRVNKKDDVISPTKKKLSNQYEDQSASKNSAYYSNRNDKRIEKNDYNTDSLNEQFSNLKLNKKVENSKPVSNTKNKDITPSKSSPWAIDTSANMFPTSSSTYGAYYYAKNK